MTTTAEQTLACPDCGASTYLETRTTLQFNGGRGDVVVDRFHCNRCRRFYNVPVEAEKKV